ncbi:type II secretion system protein N [Rhodoferax mekongensis]|uniref:Type II secretion system protein N n=1 Tax=Rhodoferax mekongensis TaxID=3068341 RepID=A0ABZ0AZ23_9BURK|nr:type II secretion system protein N [Rhodoferax sp. TBRC 17307]WNO04735.1 type II secretion system protein N [Rhodoferax sp. TBRC 17307]
MAAHPLLLRKPLPTLTERASSMGTSRYRAPWVWAVSGITLGLLAGALVFAPARWLAAGLDWAGSPLQLHNAQGTLWNGSGQLTFQSGAQGSTALPGPLEWTLRPAWIHQHPGLRVQWRADCCLSQPWVWRISTDLHTVQLQTDDLPASQPLRMPASMLTGLGTPWNTLQPQGRLELSTRALEIRLSPGGLQLQGTQQLDALGVSTSLSTLKPIGSYRFVLQGATHPGLTLSTLEGALQLRGSGVIQSRRVVFDGEATAAEGREEALSNLLNIIGQRQGARSLIHLG